MLSYIFEGYRTQTIYKIKFYITCKRFLRVSPINQLLETHVSRFVSLKNEHVFRVNNFSCLRKFHTRQNIYC